MPSGNRPKPQTPQVVCLSCDGLGVIKTKFGRRVPCENCRGTGKFAIQVGLECALAEFAADESLPLAIAHAEKWRDALEEMWEVGSPGERVAVLLLLDGVRKYLVSAMKHPKH